MTLLLWVIAVLFGVWIVALIWMRFRRRVSKAHFALATISALVTTLMLGLSSLSSGLPMAAVSKLFEVFGFGPIETGTQGSSVIVLTALALGAIFSFGVKAINSWDAPLRVSELKLGEKYLENNLFALAAEQARLLLKRQEDPIASEAVADWKERLTEPPQPVGTKDLLRELLTSAYREIRIPDDGWRDEDRLWTGEMLGLTTDSTRQMFALVFENNPTEENIVARVNLLREKVPSLHEKKVFAVYVSRGDRLGLQHNIDVENSSIQVMSSRDLILMGLDLKNYAHELLRSFNTAKAGGTKATLQNSYVDLFVKCNDNSSTPLLLPDTIHRWINANDNSHLAITGEYGQGKSTALLKYCCDWAERFIETGFLKERVPLLIELRGKTPSETDPLAFLSEWCSRYGLIPQQVMSLIKSGEAIVIFEGFDELRNAGRPFHRHQHFNALWRFAYPGAKLIFTGRPNFFLDQSEANRTLRNENSRATGGGAHTVVWRLLKMNREQVGVACRSYEETVQRGILAAISENEEFFEIVSRPSMLPVVATIWGDISDLQADGITLTGAVLIERYIQAIFSRKEEELEKDRVLFDAPPGSRYLLLPKEVREILTMCVAWRMSGLKQKNTISRSEISEMIRDLYDTLFAIGKAKGVTPEIAKGLIEFEKRHEDENPADRVEAITAEICSSGLLVPDPVGGVSNLRFPHKQFLEYLIAKAVLISRSGKTPNGFKIILKSSSDAGSLTRLHSEPNSIKYLAECTGNDLSEIFSVNERRMLSACLVLLLVSERANLYLQLGMKVISKHLQGKGKFLNFISEIFQPINEQEEIYDNDFRVSEGHANSRSRFLATNSAYFFFGTLSIGLVLGLTVAEVSDTYLMELALTIPLAVLTGLFVRNGRMLVKSVLLQTLFHLLSLRWIGAGQVPKNKFKKIELAIQSMSQGVVIYPEQQISVENNSSYFLYPASSLNDTSLEDSVTG